MGYKRIIRKIAKFILASQPDAFVQINVGQIQAGNILQGKKIVITGGGSGLGYAMAKKFISEGAEVVISGRNADKLKAAIANDSEGVINFFSQLSQNLYSTLGNKLRTSNSMSSYMSVYNDKEMATQYSEYNKKISDQETKISTWEEIYYKKFSRMESALAALNAQSSSISGLFG